MGRIIDFSSDWVIAFVSMERVKRMKSNHPFNSRIPSDGHVFVWGWIVIIFWFNYQLCVLLDFSDWWFKYCRSFWMKLSDSHSSFVVLSQMKNVCHSLCGGSSFKWGQSILHQVRHPVKSQNEQCKDVFLHVWFRKPGADLFALLNYCAIALYIMWYAFSFISPLYVWLLPVTWKV